MTDTLMSEVGGCMKSQAEMNVQWPSRILVATNGSASADAAIAAATLLAGRSNASVEMMTVYVPRVSLPVSPTRGGFRQCEKPDRGDAARLLAAVRRQRTRCMRSSERRSCPLRLEIGDPCALIIRAAKESSADLLVLSLGGREPSERLRGDRTVLCLARYCSTPVYVAVSNGEKPQRCVVAFPDGLPHGPTLRAVLRCLSAGSRMWIAVPDRSPMKPADGRGSESARDFVARAVGAGFERELESIEIEMTNVDGDMLAGVLRIADDVGANLIAAPNRGAPGPIRTFLPNLAEPLLYSARCSVLIVPDEVPATESSPSEKFDDKLSGIPVSIT
jgi:nucleotide-binding universal stress UspA family protein